MSSPPKVLLITGNNLRHRYVAGVLAKRLDLCGVISEGKSQPAAHLKETTQKEDNLINAHFAHRDEAEREILGDIREFPACDLLEIPAGTANDQKVYEWVTAHAPEAVILYGSSIIKDPLLSHFEGRMINMHLGLSPYYRGSATNYWPLVDGLPECVGVTIHLATLKVDGGAILTQVRAENLQQTDNSHEIGNKAIIAGVKALTDIVSPYLEGKITPIPQDLKSGKLCRRKDFTPESLVTMHGHFKAGMITDYLKNKTARDASYPIISP